MIGFWLALVTVLSVTFTPLGQMARDHSNQEVLPSNSAVTMATRQMTKALREPGIQNIALVVLTDYRGMSNADENVYRTLVDKLRRDKRDVVMMQDFVSQPPLRQVVTSKDNKAWFFRLALRASTLPPSYGSSLGCAPSLCRRWRRSSERPTGGRRAGDKSPVHQSVHRSGVHRREWLSVELYSRRRQFRMGPHGSGRRGHGLSGCVNRRLVVCELSHLPRQAVRPAPASRTGIPPNREWW